VARKMQESGMIQCSDEELGCICPLLGRCFHTDPVWVNLIEFPHRLRGTRIFFCAAAKYLLREGFLFRNQQAGGSFVGFMDSDRFSMRRMLDLHVEDTIAELLCVMDLETTLSLWQMAASYDESMASLQDEHGDVYLFLFFTEPEKRGFGHGSAIIRSLQEGLREHGLHCSLSTHNEKNLALYNHLGFRTVRSQFNIKGDAEFFLHYP